MNTLRNAYSIQKNRHNEIISEAAINWLKNNVVLINEKIDRKTVSRLIDSIQKFEDTFGPYKQKLPTLAAHLELAERSLNLVITGRVSDKKTSNLLEQLTYLYSTFSDFFTRDLPVLLKTKLFKAAKENPTIPLNRLHVQAGGFDLFTTREALQNALRPSPEEKRLLRKIYKGTALPKINSAEITEQIMNLTFSDLEELTNIGRVPMAVTDKTSSELATEPSMPEAFIRQDGDKFLSEDVADSVLQKASEIAAINSLLAEASMLNEVNVAQIQPSLQALKKLVSSVQVLNVLQGPVSDLQSKVLAALADGDVKSYISQATSSKNPINILKNLFSTPQGTIISQANMAIETLKNVSKAWNEIKAITEKDNVTDADINNIKKILTKNVKGGIVSKIGAMFKTQPFPGLTPDDVLAALFAPLDEFLANKDQTNESIIKIKNVMKEQADGVDALGQFKNAMSQLSSALSGRSNPGTAASKSSTAPAQTKTSTGTEPGAPAKTTQPQGTAKPDTDQTSDNIAAAFKGKLKPDQISQLTSILTKQGYAVIKNQ